MLATGRRYYDRQQNLTALGVRQVRRRRAVGLTAALNLLATYQAESALLAMEYGPLALEEQGVAAAGAALVPTAFTVAPEAPSVLEDIDPSPQFDRIVGTLIQDAGRSAMGTWAASRRQEMGHIRQLVAPSCQRCAVLAGRWYRWSDGFDRHPQCDCDMLPAPREAALYDPYGAYDRGEITDLTRAQRDAIDAGADINQVVNAKRGMQTVNFAGRRVQVTLEGTTSRGLAFRSLAQRGGTTARRGELVTRNTRNGAELRRVTREVAKAPRLSPEAIYKVAAGDRDTAVRLLRANGYIL